MKTSQAKEIYRCCLQTVTPMHIGTDEVYEPTGFVVDASVPQLVVVEPIELIRSLSADERLQFAKICAQGTIGSILEVYKFLRNRRPKGRSVAVCKDFVTHYQNTLSISARNERHVQQELNRFEIPRTAFRPIDGRAYIPGSSIKGALRTAYLNLMEKRKALSSGKRRYQGNTLQQELLDFRKIPEDPFRMIKVSDFRPVGNAPTKIIYAVNEKKKPSDRPARGQALLMEMVAPGATFVGEISVERPGPGAPIHSPITLENLLEGAREFFGKEREREANELKVIGVKTQEIKPPSNVWHLRCGRHSGAESVTVEGHRSIRIMGKRGERQFLDHATTLWLASESRVPRSKDDMLPMGWAVVAPLTGAMAQKCDEAESEYQESLTRLKMRAKTATPPPSPATENEVSKPSTAMVAKAGPSKEVWPSANLTWDPGPGILTANSPKGKATTKDKDLIPESIQARLFKKGKKKSVVAEVEVEPRGNSFNIVTIKV